MAPFNSPGVQAIRPPSAFESPQSPRKLDTHQRASTQELLHALTNAVQSVCAAYDQEVTSLRLEIDRLQAQLQKRIEDKSYDSQPRHSSCRKSSMVAPMQCVERSSGDIEKLALQSTWEPEGIGSRVIVNICSATRLRDADIALGQGSSDPYCICRVVGRPETEFQTDFVANCLNPIWNYQGEVSVRGHHEQLEFVVMDKDWLKSDDFLGKATLSLTQLDDHGFFSGRLGLDPAGEISVEVSMAQHDTEYLKRILNASLRRWPLVRDVARSQMVAKQRAQSRMMLEVKVLSSLKAGSLMQSKHRIQCLVLHPSGHVRMCWDTGSIFVLAYDIFMVPMMMCFDLKMTTALLTISAFVTVFWTLDMISHFFTGFYDKGLVEMRFMRIAKKYMQSWLIFDLCVVITDWTFLAITVLMPTSDGGAEGQSSNVRVVRILRVFRSLKLVSFMRVTRIKQGYAAWFNFVHSSIVQSISKAVQGLVLILSINHVLACIWYKLGTIDHAGKTWVRTKELQNHNVWYNYLTSFHWALTQFTPASVDIQPQNMYERAYVLIVDILGLVMVSTFVSGITSRMTQIRSMRSHMVAQENDMRKFFYDNSVSLEIMSRVQHYISKERNKSAKQRLRPHKVELFASLPEHLLRELLTEVYAPCLYSHPFWSWLGECEHTAVVELCNKAVSESSHAPSDLHFVKDQMALGLHFIQSGLAKYERLSCNMPLHKGSWICEASLWVHGWRHLGNLRAHSATDVITVEAGSFQEVIGNIQSNRGTGSFIQQYAGLFVRDPCDQLDPELRCSDMWLDACSAKQLVVLASVGMSGSMDNM